MRFTKIGLAVKTNGIQVTKHESNGSEWLFSVPRPLSKA
jgi:hypothetical protein